MMTSQVKLKDPRTCRVFVSSPFGGLEREREELVARYFPQLAATCQARGVQFVAVDMRWGITDEAAKGNRTVDICLREIDRSDIFVGLFAQRYGWHGLKDEKLQRNLDFSVKSYPWLKSVRDKSVTELEFLHGHLNKPGSMPATFAFRAKTYDDKEYITAETTGNEMLKKKFVVENSAAKDLLDQLKQRVLKFKDKCLAVHVDYATPEEGARLIFEDMKKYIETVLLKNSTSQTQRDLELASHDAHRAKRMSLYVGGQGYMKELDQKLQKGDFKHLFVGPSGSGKGALVSNWLAAIRKKKSHELVYHFVGCSKDSSNVTSILKRLTVEFERIGGTTQRPKGLEDKPEVNASSVEIADMFHKMKVALDKAAKRKKILLVIDGLSKVQQQSRTSKTLFWLPVELPQGVTVVVTCREGCPDVLEELTKQRGYTVTRLEPLSLKDRQELCIGILKQNGKELSPEQLKTITEAEQAKNPLFLKILISELCTFGNFRLLDNKIETLAHAKSVAELFQQFLTRLEEDYKTNSTTNLIEQVMCGLFLARKGLSENEIRGVFDIPSAAWSPLYFAVRDFLLDHSGLLRLAFDELREAVEKRYLSTKVAKETYLKQVIDYFEKQRSLWSPLIELENVSVTRVAQELPWLWRSLGDKSGLISTLTDPHVFGRLYLDMEYELLELWRTTGRSGVQIAHLYLDAIDRFQEKLEILSKKESFGKIIDIMLLPYLDAVSYTLELGHFTDAQEGVLQRRLEILEAVSGKMDEERRQQLSSQARLRLSYVYAEMGRYQDAQKLQQDVLAYRNRVAESANGPDSKTAMKDLAVCYHAIGLLHSKQGNIDCAIENYQKSMLLHAKMDNPVELADSLNNLGVMFMKKGDYQQASALCKKALEIYEEEFFGHLPPLIGVMIGNLAVCYRNLNCLDESEQMYKKALEIAERALGRMHPNVGVALANLGTLEVNRQCYEQAEKYLQEALAILKACVTPQTDEDFFKAREKYLYTLIKLNKPSEALEAFKVLYEQATVGGLLPRASVLVWTEVLSLMLLQGKPDLVGSVAAALLGAGVKNPTIFILLHKADLSSKCKGGRPKELSLEAAMELFPTSLQLIKYQAEEILIPAGNVNGLLALLDRADAASKSGPDLCHAAVQWCQHKNKQDMVPTIYRHAADRFPDNLNFVVQVAEALRDAEKYDEAEVYAQRMLEIQASDPNTLLFAGEIILRKGNTAQAGELFRKVMKLCKPDSDEAVEAQKGLKVIELMAKQKK